MISSNAIEINEINRSGITPVMAEAGEIRTPPYMPGSEDSKLEPLVVEALKSVYDPEIPVSVFELGLIYDIRISASGQVNIVMTLTTPMCPVAEVLPQVIEQAIRAIPGVTDVKMELVWEPFWKPEFMSQEARLQLGLL